MRIYICAILIFCTTVVHAQNPYKGLDTITYDASSERIQQMPTDVLTSYAGHLSQEEYSQELKCMAYNLYHEARGEGDKGMRAVGEVTIQRALSSSFPDTVCSVVYQPKQFSWTHDDISDVPMDLVAYFHAVDLAQQLLHAEPTVLGGEALYFHASYIATPKHAIGRPVIARIGKHIFY